MSHLIPAKDNKFARKNGSSVRQSALLLDDTSVFNLPVLMLALGHTDPSATHRFMKQCGIEPDLKYQANMIFVGSTFREQILNRKVALDETGDSVRQKSREPIPTTILAGPQNGEGATAKRQNQRASRGPVRRKQDRADA